MYNFIVFTKAAIRKNAMLSMIVLACGLVGVVWGWYASKLAFKNSMHANTLKPLKQESIFLLPPRPPVALEQPSGQSKEVTANLADLRIWEVSVRQPLPPRKEPMTAPGWKIVGVTTVGNDTNVLLLFDKQIEIEARKVGDLLPGGAKIIQVAQDALRIVLNGQYMELRIHKQ